MTRKAGPKAGKTLFWLLLALPAIGMISGLARDTVLAMDLLHPSGETAIRLMILAMLPGPLADFFGPSRFLRGWLAIRRNLGVAAFAYALLHLAFYIIDMRLPAAMLGELGLPGIWTGWLALLMMIPPAAISMDRAMRALGRKWKTVQRIVYAALLVALAHWLLLDREWQPAAIHLTPLIVAWSLRLAARFGRRKERALS